MSQCGRAKAFLQKIMGPAHQGESAGAAPECSIPVLTGFSCRFPFPVENTHHTTSPIEKRKQPSLIADGNTVILSTGQA